eukprot:scaffold509_cov315-Pavlova_lutheri.AAC.7
MPKSTNDKGSKTQLSRRLTACVFSAVYPLPPARPPSGQGTEASSGSRRSLRGLGMGGRRPRDRGVVGQQEVHSRPRNGGKGRDEASTCPRRLRKACLPSFESILLETTQLEGVLRVDNLPAAKGPRRLSRGPARHLRPVCA